MSIKPTNFELFNDDSVWGNQTAGDLTNEEILTKNWDRVTENNRRWANPEFRKKRDESLTKVIQSDEWKQKQKLANQLMRTEEWKEKHYKVMQELYETDKWKNSVQQANSNPVRNLKISKSHKLKITTPDGVFDSIKECAKFYNITGEGVRYRCMTDPDWIKEDNKKISSASVEKRSKSASKNANKRLTTIANKNGFIITPYGKFLSVRSAWNEEKKHNDVIANPHNWFLKMFKEQPSNYYKTK
jgi:hypothetical protein